MRRGERGQTLILVAVSLIALMGMAALAVDLVTLYAARSEVQRAADAAALAGAKALADSGITTLQGSDPAYGIVQTLAKTTASAMINQVVARNLVAGAPAALSGGTPTYSFPTTNDPTVTVTLQRTSLPVFFAKIWGQKAASVSATAVAEAYSPTGMSPYTPIAPTGVKPFLVLNLDPTGNPFIDTSSGIVEAGIITGTPVTLYPACTYNAAGGLCTFNDTYQSPQSFYYLPALVAGTSNICPACSSGSTNFEQSISCSDTTTAYSCGVGANWDPLTNPHSASGPTQEGTQCLIHAVAPALGEGQDILNSPSTPQIPLQITAQSGPQFNKLVTTSSSIVTVPVIEVTPNLNTNPAVTITGYMQAFINYVGPAGGLNVTIMNVSGCSAGSNGATPITGGNSSTPVPVRLITPP
jgi:Flp pilus assembly protein TadG